MEAATILSPGGRGRFSAGAGRSRRSEACRWPRRGPGRSLASRGARGAGDRMETAPRPGGEALDRPGPPRGQRPERLAPAFELSGGDRRVRVFSKTVVRIVTASGPTSIRSSAKARAARPTSARGADTSTATERKMRTGSGRSPKSPRRIAASHAWPRRSDPSSAAPATAARRRRHPQAPAPVPDERRYGDRSAPRSGRDRDARGLAVRQHPDCMIRAPGGRRTEEGWIVAKKKKAAKKASKKARHEEDTSRKATAHQAARKSAGKKQPERRPRKSRPEGGAEEEGLRGPQAAGPAEEGVAPLAGPPHGHDGSRSRRRSPWPRLRPRRGLRRAKAGGRRSFPRPRSTPTPRSSTSSRPSSTRRSRRARRGRNGVVTPGENGSRIESSKLPLPGSCSAREKKVPRNRDLRIFERGSFRRRRGHDFARMGVGRRFLSRFTYVTSASVTLHAIADALARSARRPRPRS